MFVGGLKEPSAPLTLDEQFALLRDCYYSQRRLAPEEHPILLVAPPGMDQKTYVKRTQIMFEDYNVPALLQLSSAMLSLFSLGKKDGLVLECSSTHTHAVPIVDALVDATSSLQWPYGGQDTDKRLLQLMEPQTSQLKLSHPSLVSHEVNQTLCHGRGLYNLQIDDNFKRECAHYLMHGTTWWNSVQLLHIGRTDPQSTLYGQPRDVVNLIGKFVRAANEGLVLLARSKRHCPIVALSGINRFTFCRS
jgi:actin-related protein